MISKCLYPVAGYGTRFLPATKSMPKEMLPIVNKPLIQYGVEEAVSAGMTNMAFVTGRGKRAIPDHFDFSYELETEISGSGKEAYLKETRELIEKCTFSYTRQRQMKGLGDAILTGETLVGNQPFGVILADDLCLTDGESVMSQMVKLFEEFQCSIVAIQEVPTEEIHKYGVIKGERIRDDVYRVETMVEKPKAEDAPSNLAVIGRYILTPDIFDILRNTPPGKGGEIQLTDAIMTQAQQGKVIAYKFKGKRFDCGHVDGFIEATNYVYQNIYKANS
ncbi:MAG: UTP--glucose-1-phosphate uridylyltransferase GalU [Acidiferrobacterales bacterium]|nr:UTP--glucose-1-phosphate uridylyltransferase GalU [Acidiferrobacterales bacterium]